MRKMPLPRSPVRDSSNARRAAAGERAGRGDRAAEAEHADQDQQRIWSRRGGGGQHDRGARAARCGGERTAVGEELDERAAAIAAVRGVVEQLRVELPAERLAIERAL